jgi:hypothetical protein
MASDQKRESQPKAAEKAFSHSRKRAETRLALPQQANAEAAEAALKRVIEEWLLPTLLEEFLREHGISPKTGFFAKTQY